MSETTIGVRLRRMGLQDLEEVVDAHLAAFPAGFFARLGRHFLIRYYRTFLDGPLAVAIVAEDSGEMRGYLVGILDPTRHRRLLLNYHGMSLAAWGFIGLMRRPVLLVRFAGTRARRYVRTLWSHRIVPDSSDAARAPAVLSHLVVAPTARDGGLGTRLVEAFLHQAIGAGCRQACLVTVAGPDGAGEFYERIGWTPGATRRGADGRRLAYYRLDLGG